MTVLNNDNQATSAVPALAFYGKMLTFSRLQFSTDDLSVIDTELAKTLSNKSSNIPILIDSEVEQDLSALVELLWSWGLQPIGVVTGTLDEQARAQRLAIFPADGKRIERILPSKKAPAQVSAIPENKGVDSANSNDITSNNVASNNVASNDTATNDTDTVSESATETTISTVTAETLVSAEHITSLIYDQMLRSGQSLNHVGGDLILTNSVNSGAEAITDNSLHIYGRAQGRLVAGATGDKDARIFCQVFNPSLVSVAGTYCLRDNLPEHVIDKSVQVRFIEGEGLVFTVMDDA